MIASECTVPVYTHTLRLHDLLNNDARYIKEYVHTYTMLYMYTKPSGNHNRSRSAGALFFPYTIAGRNPSFLGSTCLTQTVLEMPPPLVLIGLHTFPLASSGTRRRRGKQRPVTLRERDMASRRVDFSLMRILKGTERRAR